METGAILALDLGTTNFKAALFAIDDLRLLGLARMPTPVRSPHPSYQEIDPAEFSRTISELIGVLRNQYPDAFVSIRAVTFSTQTNSFLLLDENDEPLTPLILWSDERANGEIEGVLKLQALPEMHPTTGMIRLGHFGAAAKIGWIQQHQPDAAKRARRICLISDYLTLLLIGKHVTEGGVAGFTGLLDIHSLTWWQEGCQAAGIPLSWLPRVVRAGCDLGPLLPDFTKAHGLPVDCRLIAGCLDQYAGAIGAGNDTPGAVSETTGTVLTTIRCSDQFDSSTGLAFFQGPSFQEGRYWQMALEGRGASLLEALRNALPGRPEYSDLNAEAARTPPGADGIRLARPLILNSGTDPTEAFDGWTPDHTRGHMVRCVMETIAFFLVDQVRMLCGEQLPPVLRCCGGAARSSVWLQIKADVLGIPCEPAPCEEPACLGVAMLASATLQGLQVSDLPKPSDVSGRMMPRPEIHREYWRART